MSGKNKIKTIVESYPLECMSQSKFYEGYSRYLDEKERYETWEEAVTRVMNMHKDFYKNKPQKLTEYIDFAEKFYLQKRVLGAQRALQFGGKELLKHQIKMYNCVSSYADRVGFFGEIAYMLLCGAGAGFSVQKHHVSKLPTISSRNKSAKTFVVPDSIEGWADAFSVLVSSYFTEDQTYPEYHGRKIYFDLNKIRPKGAFISGGFKAPGPEPLRLALDRIEQLIERILSEGIETLRPIHVYDIVMHIADAVISGGVRRSATICLFSLDDEEMINAKTGKWLDENPQRARSNNSAVCLRDEITREQFYKIMESVRFYGEPGFIFTDSLEFTYNPCVEIGKLPQINGKSGWQACNLTEINGGQCDTREKFFDACKAAAILGTLQAGYTDFKYLDEISREIIEREALIGVSITGWMNNPEILFDEDILKEGAEIVKKTNKEVAKILGINPAARTTCVKPSGNASILLKTASGIHAEHSPRYIRNVQMNKESEVAKLLKEKNPTMCEESTWSANNSDWIFSFPVVTQKGSIYKEDLYGVNQLEYVKKAQQVWIENGTNVELCADPRLRHNVSNTITVDDWDEVAEYVYDNRQWFAGISFISMSGDKDYNQAPFIEVKSAQDIVTQYGDAAMFASGLIVDGLEAFSGNLWKACDAALNDGEDLDEVSHENLREHDFVRRFKKFANGYFNGDLQLTSYCLKDVHILHRWNKIVKNMKTINWAEELKEKQYTDIDTMGAQACAGGVCDLSIDF